MRELAVLCVGLCCLAGGGVAFWVQRQAALDAEARAAAAAAAAQRATARRHAELALPGSASSVLAGR